MAVSRAGHALFYLVILTMLEGPAAADPNSPDPQSFCVASDGHYVLYSDAFPTGQHNDEELRNAWYSYLKSAKPHIDVGDDRTYKILQCVSLAGDVSQIELKREAAVDEAMRSSRSVHSFSTGWRTY